MIPERKTTAEQECKTILLSDLLILLLHPSSPEIRAYGIHLPELPMFVQITAHRQPLEITIAEREIPANDPQPERKVHRKLLREIHPECVPAAAVVKSKVASNQGATFLFFAKKLFSGFLFRFNHRFQHIPHFLRNRFQHIKFTCSLQPFAAVEGHYFSVHVSRIIGNQICRKIG